MYLNEIKKYPLLSEGEEKELAKRIKEGDKKALERLILGNLRFVVNIAKEYQGKGLSLAELINEGNYGLIKAANKFDETKNVKFISYAVWWIRQSIMKAILENNSNIRVPLSQITKINAVNRVQQEILDNENRIPTFKEIADKIGMTENEVKNILSLNKIELSLSDPVGSDDNLYLGDTIAEESNLSPEEALLRKRYKETLQSQLEKLSERESYVLKKYFGLEDYRPHTLEEIGRELNISRERVRQIKDRAINKLKEMSKNVLEPYDG
ncbi:MAG: RNA polymerase sigma factor [candidate division TA06 bacterium 32_111]|uniref:RNA polymerase sigma factor n=2 Tax=Bacteria candidate phyla TaxID=1783234 RepID=A0A117M6R0_UNCT6|nr:MAG: RNA polymerase sigma factor [candidate division TA06 bacterium 32_111]KUK87475.1 MAG: RNA polymerase sigma factor [candidate division TA06 bacterium 34_109]HAF08188.1 RNA polymerase subunit sigma [candidate division WOR-3 bacterium]HCP16750.1 RNA polymerase subunit sigma [candidate division WOR-3 bacterium]